MDYARGTAGRPLATVDVAGRGGEAATQHVVLLQQLHTVIIVLINTVTYLKENGMDARIKKLNKRRSGRAIYIQFRARIGVHYLLICSSLV